MIRAVRSETGADHDTCRQLLEETDGDIDRAASLWYERRRPATHRQLAHDDDLTEEDAGDGDSSA
jgi:translation elongation factor EF-Ts